MRYSRRQPRWWPSLPGAILAVLLVLGITAAFAAGGTKALPPPDPDRGLSDAQRLQAHQAIRDQFDQRLATWKRDLNTATLPWETLPHADLNASYLPPLGSLNAAKAQADLIVVAISTGVSFAADGGTVLTVSIERVLKGGVVSGSLSIREAGGPMPTSDWKGVMIADSLDAPILLPKHRAILFLARSRDGTFTIQSFTGMYAIQGGQVLPLRFNPFAESLRNMNEASFVLEVAR